MSQRCSRSLPVKNPATVGRSWWWRPGRGGGSRRPPPPAVGVVLEPGQPVGEHALGGQPLPHPGLDRAQVLAHHQGLGGQALQGQDPEQVVGRVADVGALGRLGPSGIQNRRNRPITWSMRRPAAWAMPARMVWANGP